MIDREREREREWVVVGMSIYECERGLFDVGISMYVNVCERERGLM